MGVDISIIVPVYKVEQYLDKCINSIINQDIQNFEIILVDDGSPDGCPEICDRYAEKYDNISVLHKANGGLSDARNAGVKIANGNFIVFIDSDDYVDPDHISSLWTAVQKYNADIACSSPIKEYQGKENSLPDRGTGQSRLYTKREAQSIMLRGKPIGTSAWAKIYRKEFCLKHPFPKGKVMEELATVYYLFDEADKIAVVDRKTYHYIQRGGSILHSSFSLQEIDEYMSLAEKYVLNAPNEEIKKSAAFRMVLLGSRFCETIDPQSERDKLKLIVDYCHKYLGTYIFDNQSNIREKTKAVLLSSSTFGASIVSLKRRIKG